MKLASFIVVCAVGLISLLLLQPTKAVNECSFTPTEEIAGGEPIQPVPLQLNLDRKKVELGRKLFHEPMLSVDRSISCASCHDLSAGGVDGRAKSIGVHGAVGDVNAPTVFNAGLQFHQFWDGRAASLEEQVSGPILDPKEMGCDWTTVLQRLSDNAEYADQFHAIYGDLRQADVTDAISAFERSLNTPNSRFDQYLRGQQSAISKDELEGYRLFKERGCVSCHQGVAVGGNMFQPFGVIGNYFLDRGNVTKADFGRFNATGREGDRYKFKVPSLRNVELTAPYFHDGTARTLEDAVNVMAKYQLGSPLDQDENKLIVKFLKTLTGQASTNQP